MGSEAGSSRLSVDQRGQIEHTDAIQGIDLASASWDTDDPTEH